MRTIRWMASGLALVALMPAIGAAQSGRLFKNSWFWGAKTGLLSYSTNTGSKGIRPMVGAEWLITASRGALYLSGDQTFFNANSSIVGSSGQSYMVGIHDLRRYTAALLAFPASYGMLHPYGGVGMSINIIRSATVQDPVAAGDETLVAAELQDEKSRASFIALAGLQVQYQRFSVFGQVTYMPTENGFLLNARPSYLLEAGIRFNVSSAQDRP
ncbi:MAG TPA: hypothetical protein VFW98_18185 [Gemmatimonadaceae bacterium]|nr:hypothetical protein [Gemmatimonadaceae bacterium]